MLNEKDKAIVEKIKAGQVFDEDAVSQLLRIIDSLESQGSLLERLLREKNEIGFDNGFCRIAYYNSFYYYGNSDGSETVFNTFHELASFLESQLKQTNG